MMDAEHAELLLKDLAALWQPAAHTNGALARAGPATWPSTGIGELTGTQLGNHQLALPPPLRPAGTPCDAAAAVCAAA